MMKDARDPANLASVHMLYHREHIVIKMKFQGTLRWQEVQTQFKEIVPYDISADGNAYIRTTLLFKIKPILYNLPFEKINFVISPEIKENYLELAQMINSFIQKTNQCLASVSHLKDVAKGHDTLLFLNPDANDRAVTLYEQIKDLDPERIIYQEFSTGWNAVKRCWELAKPPWSPQELVAFIVEKKIKKIFSMNMYFLELYFNSQGIYLLALMKYLGVEYVIHDMDGQGGTTSGYVERAFFNCLSFERMGLPYEASFWDGVYGMENDRFAVPPQKYDGQMDFKPLKEDYAILVMSHSRIQGVKPQLKAILFLLDHLDKDRLLSEAPMFFYAMQYMILKVLHLSTFERLFFHARLGNFFLHVVNFLKYEIIHNIRTERKIEIYGDDGWAQVFPAYYQNRYLKEPEKLALHGNRGHLYLLLNQSLSYLHPPAPLPDAICRNAPFLSYDPPVETPAFKGFRHLGYLDFDELNTKLENINTIFTTPELLQSISAYKEIYNTELNRLATSLIPQGNTRGEKTPLEALYMEEMVAIEEKITAHLDTNEASLRGLFDVLIRGKSVQYDVTASPYYGREYVQRFMGGN